MLESEEVEGEAFDDLVEELATVVNHQLTDEELSILDPAPNEVGQEARSALGEAFAARRNDLLADDAGSLDDVAGSWIRRARTDCLTPTDRGSTDVRRRSAGRASRAR